MNIRLANIQDLKQLLHVYNQVTADLHEKGINQWEYPWCAEKLLNKIKNHEMYVLVDDSVLIGAFCIEEINQLSGLAIDSASVYLSQIAILPENQRKGIGLYITEFACSYAMSVKKKIYLDCWAGNEKLKNFYLKAGFDYQGDLPEEDYSISIFSFG
ncbi:GNAT family N-acetyltransferase [Metabacillus sp. JX24]|uniref:GNAT family N-acetyltransferase n=1 Tax=Metabacillus sp. JX24 TaxID=3240759 RepID=UPI003510A9C8